MSEPIIVKIELEKAGVESQAERVKRAMREIGLDPDSIFSRVGVPGAPVKSEAGKPPGFACGGRIKSPSKLE